MATFNVPTREQVSSKNQEIFDNLQKGLGFVPNLFATFAHSENALSNVMTLSNAPTSLKAKEKEVVNLAVSQVNECQYCLSAHTAVAGMNGFSQDEILSLRAGRAPFDAKLDALAKLSRNLTENRGSASEEVIANFFDAGWTKENLVDTIVLVGDKTITNYLHKTTQVPVDFPVAVALEAEMA